MEASQTDRPVSLHNNRLQQVPHKTVPGGHPKTPLTSVPAAKIISLHGNASFIDLPPKALVYDSVSRPTTPAFSTSSTTCLLPTKSSTTDSNTIAPPNDNSVEGHKPSTTSSKCTFSSLWRNWKWEIGACGLILAVPAIMVATLFPHRNHPIPQWPFEISINALLSIYTLVFKSAMAYVVTSCVGQLQWAWFSSGSRPLSDVVLFDEAGRSPWGLLAILWAHRLRQPLTILAAVIMICGLAIDPFVQQLIRPFDCDVPLDDDIATLPRTNKLEAYFSSAGDEQQSTTPMIHSALIAGLYSSGNEIPWKCSTGNCTFPDAYSTLGICSACKDRSADTMVESVVLNPSAMCGSQNITTYIQSGDDGYYWGVKDDQLSTTFSDGCNGVGHTDVAHMDVWAPMPANSFSARIDIVVGKTTFSDDRVLMSTGENITGCDTAEAGNTWACRGYGAASCTLSPCVRTYSASIEAGYLKERLVSQSPDIPWAQLRDGYYYGLLDTQCVSEQESAFLTARGYELNNSTRWIPFYGDPDYDSSSLPRGKYSSGWLDNLESLFHHRCVYAISGEILYKVGYGNGNGPFANNPAASQFIGTVQGLSWDMGVSDRSVINTFNGPEVLQKIYNYGRVDFERVQSVFENISESLTTYIRTYGNASYSEPATGRVQHYAICLGIQWPWIALPAALAALTILFLMLVVESTGRHETPLWKDSPLPWILGGGLEVGNRNSPAGSPSRPNAGASVARMEDESGHILATVSEGTAPRIELVDLRNHSI